jgi:hypothetical protein
MYYPQRRKVINSKARTSPKVGTLFHYYHKRKRPRSRSTGCFNVSATITTLLRWNAMKNMERNETSWNTWHWETGKLLFLWFSHNLCTKHFWRCTDATERAWALKSGD